MPTERRAFRAARIKNKGRIMANNQSIEDYLEAILLLSKEIKNVHQIDVARRVGVSQPAVKKAINILLNSGYIVLNGLHICLTESGKQYAEGVYSRHCTVKNFLLAHGVSEQNADADACLMEHVISGETFEMMRKWLKNEG